MHIPTLISAAITLLGALVIVIWMPGRGAAARSAADAASPASAAEAAGHAEPVPAPARIPVGAATPAGMAAPVMTAGTVSPADGMAADGSHASITVKAEG
jgi:hypothetical protein